MILGVAPNMKTLIDGTLLKREGKWNLGGRASLRNTHLIKDSLAGLEREQPKYTDELMRI